MTGRQSGSRGLWWLAAVCLAVLLAGVPARAYEVIVDDSGTVEDWDNRDSVTTACFMMKKPNRWDSESDGDAYGGSHRVSDHNDPKPVRWYPMLAQPGDYTVYMRWVADGDRADDSTVKVKYNNGNSSATMTIDQTTNGGTWVELGTWSFSGTNSEYVQLKKENNSDTASADAVRFVKVTANTPPAAVADSLTVAEGGTATTLDSGANSVLSNDSDADGDPLTAVLVSDVSHGSLTLNNDGTFSYTHDGSETTSDSFTYKANDGTDDSSVVTVAITVTPVNDAPVATDDSYSVDAGSSNNRFTVLANDSDAEGDSLTVASVDTTGTRGTVVNRGGDVLYTPPLLAIGNDSFSYTVSDGHGGTATATVSISITRVNSPPTANDDSFTVNEDTAGNILAVLANDTDPDVSDTLTVSAVDTSSTQGTVTNNGTNLSYTPPADYTGTDSLSYTVSDGNGGTDTATVTITVANVNDAPVATAESITAVNGGSVSILDSGATSVLANDTDIDGDSLTAVLVSTVSHGLLTLNSDGSFLYTHDGSAAATDAFTYKANDGTADSNVVTVTISIVSAGSHELSGHTVSDFTSVPLNLTDSVAPLVMIAASNDHQLFFKAFNDYSDLDGDGVADTTFKPTIAYYGYFDSYKCYDYDAVDQRFEPVAEAGESYSMTGTVTAFVPASGQTTLTVTSLSGTAGLGPYGSWTVTNLTTGAADSSSTLLSLTAPGGSITFTTLADTWITVGDTVQLSVTVPSYCTGANDAYWSGNFLNWLSMARIDVIRKILFGGHRRVDTASETVLERTYLPHDAHAFAKYYGGNDLELLTPFSEGVDFTLTDADPKKNGITFCNTTDVTGTPVSEDVTDPPLIKVARGNYSLWAGNERWQCTWASGAPKDNHGASNGNDPAKSGIDAYGSSPAYSEGIGEKNYIARVQACVAGLIGHERCKLYPGPDGVAGTGDDNYKPIGLLQTYGDDDQLLFGMIAGSYNKHVSGGVVIRNIGSMTDEINVATDGTFSKVAVAAGGPESNNQAEGLINAWSLYRITGYNHADGTYNTTDNCPWGKSAFADVSGANECRNWGNPFSEIYFQAVRYFSDAGVTGTYRSNSSTGITGLPTPQPWPNPNPLNDTNYCARVNIVAFNSSTASYDNDELDANSPGVQEVWDSSVLPGAGTSADMTDVIGQEEGIHGNQYFIGEVDVDNQADGDDQLCTPKTVTSFGDVGGLCPESPRLRGSYRVAGIAYYAHIEDIRADYLTGNRALDGVQKIDTYAVSSATAVPEISIPHPITGGPAVKILPACRNTSLNPDGNCAIVDFKIVSQVVNNGSGIGSGTFYVNWEDSEQGGDYDQDMWGTISYVIDGNTNTLEVTTDVHAQSTGYAMGFGYVLAGTTNDGFHAHAGINNFTYTDTATLVSGHDCSSGCQCRSGHGICDPAVEDPPSTARYTLGSSSAQLLEEPLWYAAKWGGFQDSNGNQIPDLQSEWDKEDEDGNPVPDGIPDNYFYATNPQQLEDALNRVFLTILKRTSSGTAAAVVSNNVRGEGALYQAYYEPLKQDTAGNTAKWIGTVHGLWLDRYGYMREDDGDGILDGYDEDLVVETYFDSAENRTRVRRWTSSDPDTFTPLAATTEELDDLQTLWNAREQLYFPTLTDLDIKTQRAYGDTAAGGRYIKTWIDSDGDGVVDSDEYVDFTAATIDSTNYTFFDLATEAEVEGLVNWLRGVEIAGYRSRTVDYDGDGTTEVMRLGDIVNSTPTLVAGPSEAFDLLYRDTSYGAFRAKYRNRRNVLYVGANDGMLHAINAGFFDADNIQFTTSGLKPNGDPATAHPLGAELWAYVPMNLQPHLKWLSDPDYTHVYYVDGKPKVFDAKIFTSGVDPTTGIDHPNGWGTVLVVGMRFGGGDMTIDTGGDGLNGDGNDKTRSSAYVIMDITDPESEPQLLAEVQPPDSSFTTVYPAVMAFKDKVTASDANKWYLIFGSGPDSFTTGESTSNAKVYFFDLDELTSPGSTAAAPSGCSLTTLNGTMKAIACDTGVASSFLGTPMVVDWDLDYKADTIYFGTIGDATGTSGRLMRMELNEDDDPSNWDAAPTTVIDVSQPVFAPVTAAVDSSQPANKWLFFGTGRLLVNGDKTSTATQSLYGVKEDGTTLLLADLEDVTDVEVQTNGNLINGPTGITSFDDLENRIATSRDGWKLDLPPILGTAGVDPATRMLNQEALLGSVLFASVYQPSTDPCATEGYSRLYGLYFRTGTSLPAPIVFGVTTTTDPVTGDTLTYSNRYIDLGFGMATSPALHSGTGSGDKGVSVFTQLSTGTIIRQQATTRGGVRSGRQAWRQR